ncbi:MAG TPA: hypothetical protein VNW68_01335 [Candidatus Limnocylindria bacterium]|nr:hypothetical protein [Candidatus Limnocylindria bacterium]
MSRASAERMPRRARRDDLLLAFAVAGGPTAWTFQLWLSWAVVELGCQLQPGELVIAGLGTSALWLVIGGLSGVVAALALTAAWRLVRRGRSTGVSGDEPLAGVRRFLALAALALNALLLGTIVLGATSPLFVPACH